MSTNDEADQVLAAVIAALRGEPGDETSLDGLDLSALDDLAPDQRRVLADQLRGVLSLPTEAGSKDAAVRRRIAEVVDRLDP